MSVGTGNVHEGIVVDGWNYTYRLINLRITLIGLEGLVGTFFAGVRWGEGQ